MSLTAYTRPCKSIGGVRNIWLADAADVDTMALGSSVETIDTITMESAKVFTLFTFDKDEAEYKITPVNEAGAIKYDVELSMRSKKLSDTLRTAIVEIATLGECGVIAVVEDANGNKIVLGYGISELKTRALQLTGGEAGTGKALNDFNGAVLTLATDTAEYPRFTTATVPVS